MRQNVIKVITISLIEGENKKENLHEIIEMLNNDKLNFSRDYHSDCETQRYDSAKHQEIQWLSNCTSMQKVKTKRNNSWSNDSIARTHYQNFINLDAPFEFSNLVKYDKVERYQQLNCNTGSTNKRKLIIHNVNNIDLYIPVKKLVLNSIDSNRAIQSSCSKCKIIRKEDLSIDSNVSYNYSNK